MKRLFLASAAVVLAASHAPAGEITELDKAASDLQQILGEQIEMPAGQQEVRVVTATLDPRTAGAWHVHPSPVYVYVTEGEVTLEVEGQEPHTVTAGNAISETVNARMRAVNATDQPVKVVIFQISTPDMEFLEEDKTN